MSDVFRVALLDAAGEVLRKSEPKAGALEAAAYARELRGVRPRELQIVVEVTHDDGTVTFHYPSSWGRWS